MKRVAAEANAWLPVGIPLTSVGEMFEGIKKMAKDTGRDPSTLELVVTAGVELHETPTQKDRIEFTGTLDQIAEDFATARKLGAAEIVIYTQFLWEGETAKDLFSPHGRSMADSKASLRPLE